MLFKLFTYFLEKSICETSLGGCSHYLLILKCCSTLFFVLFRNTNSAKHYLVAATIIFNCEILNVGKNIEQQKQSPGGVLYEKCSQKFRKKSQENTCARVSFLVKLQVKDCNFIKKRLQHRCFPVKYAKFILQNTSGGINKKRQTKSFVGAVLLKIIYTTGWLAFNVSLWNKTKNSSCSVNAENTVFVTLEQKIVGYGFLHSKWS